MGLKCNCEVAKSTKTDAKEERRRGRDAPATGGDRPAMAAHVAAWEKRRNGSKVKVDWQFSTVDARVKLRKLYPTLNG